MKCVMSIQRDANKSQQTFNNSFIIKPYENI